jgi:3-oxoacyl-[acyl-carrier-protein] synthase-3
MHLNPAASSIPLTIRASSVVTPGRRVGSDEIDIRFELDRGTIESKTGVASRFHFVRGHDSVVTLAARAAREALHRGEVQLSDIDLILAAGATPEQLIPTNAVLIHKALGAPAHVGTMDLDSTCLSFISGMEVASALLASGIKKRILLINSELGSSGINPSHLESAGLFGDAATCFILERGNEHSPRLVGSRFATYSEHSELCMLEGGGSKLPGFEFSQTDRDRYFFNMQGTKLFKMALTFLPEFVNRFLNDYNINMQSVDVVIPHQASASAVELIRQKLEIPKDRLVNILTDYGNCISASLPMALAGCLGEKVKGCHQKIKAGDKVLLVGTGAGLTLGVALLQF